MNYFTQEELQCRCGCKTLHLQDGFDVELVGLREDYGRPMVVTSCCRCADHNVSVGGHPDSLHQTVNGKYDCNTIAIDIKRPNSADLFSLVKVATKRGWSVGIAKTFIHLDKRDMIGRIPVVWTYKE
jgi:hypothetical protein